MLRPLLDKIIVRPEETTESKGGIILPDSAQKKPTTGVVLSIGPGKPNDLGDISECGFKEGDRIMYGKYSGTEVEDGGEKLVILSRDDAYAVVEDSV